MASVKQYSDFEAFSKDQAYWERNQLVSVLSKIYPSSLGWHDGKDWEDNWRNIVYITIPTTELSGALKYVPGAPLSFNANMQLSWHIHRDDIDYFRHLGLSCEEWDGHDTNEKYRRLSNIRIKKWYQFWR